ncbi:MAG: 4'-phosphopantetheinyl transferase superfamily protein [Lachnospiraceae bacterium]|nr:4'-phosphopantetheinyl transferase superfamily protein [Lachnospiraceae bacterium]
MKVYYAKVSPSIKEDTFFACMGQIEQRRLLKAENIKNEKGKVLSLAAGLLQHIGLCDYLHLPVKETPAFGTGCGKWGKPYLIQYPDVYFNLSHSGEYVCLAVAGYEVGVDIQKHQDKRENIARRFFTGADNEMLERCKGKERTERFFRIFSIRESYIKFTGRGLGQGLGSFDIDWENKAIRDTAVFDASDESSRKTVAYFEESTQVEGYSLCVCTGQKETPARWELVDLF